MADPTPYTVEYSFSGFQQSNPSRPLPAPPLDNELQSVKATIDSLIAAIKDVRRSDGRLKNQSVGPDQLSAALSIGFTLRGAWTEGAVYQAGDGVTHDDIFYSARVANTASNGNRPDLDPATWMMLFSVASVMISDGSITEAKLEATLADTVSGALQKAANLSDLASASTARANLDVPTLSGPNAFPSLQTFNDVSVLGDFSVGGTFSISSLDALSATIGTLTSAAAVIDLVNAETVRAVSGSAVAPSYSFTGDINTGIFRPGADSIGFSTGGSLRVTINAAGQLVTTSQIQGGTSIVANTFVSAGSDLRAANRVFASGLTTPTDFTTNGNEGAWLGAAGQYSGFSLASGPAIRIQRTVSDGPILFGYRSQDLVGNVAVTGSTMTFNSTSDYRRKPVSNPLEGFWSRIEAVQTYLNQWDTGEWIAGFLAHEFAEIYPNSVVGDKDAVDPESGAPIYQSMSASSLEVMADIFAALQDLRTENIALKARVEMLEAQ